MMRNWFENTAAILTVSLIAGLAIAQQQRTAAPQAPRNIPGNIPENSKFSVRIDLNAIKQTKLGAMLFELAKKKAIEEIGKEGGDEAGLAKIKEMLGMDPFEEIQSITLAAGEFEHPEKSMLAIVRLKKTAGNLEGLVLGLPDYETMDYKKHQIHSAAPDKKMRVYGAFHGKKDQNRTLVFSPNKSTLESVLDTLDSSSNTELDGSESPLVRLHLYEIPTDKLGDGPQANIAKIVKTFMLDVEDANEDIAFTAKMSTETDKQAEQVRQMAQGLIAMVDFAQSMDSNDKDLKKIREMLVGLTATREGTDVEVSLTLSAAKIASAIAEELHLDLEVNRAKREEDKQLVEAQAALAKAQQEVEKLKREVEARTEATKKLIEKIK